MSVDLNLFKIKFAFFKVISNQKWACVNVAINFKLASSYYLSAYSARGLIL